MFSFYIKMSSQLIMDLHMTPLILDRFLTHTAHLLNTRQSILEAVSFACYNDNTPGLISK